jgi:hypothetical protein
MLEKRFIAVERFGRQVRWAASGAARFGRTTKKGGSPYTIVQFFR